MAQMSRSQQLQSYLMATLRMLAERPQPDAILQLITEASAAFMEAEGSSLLLADAQSGEFVFRHVGGDESGGVREMRMPLDQGIAGWVYRNRQRAASWDVQADSRFHAAVDAMSGFFTSSLVAIPVLTKNRIVGVLEVVNLSPRTDDDLDLLEGFANQCAVILETSREWSKLSLENCYLREQRDSERSFVAVSPAMKAVSELAARAAQSSATVLLLGESGTGKEIMAHYIHERSARSGGPFVAVNSAGLSEDLLESELFGHEKGAFTGAHARKHGKLEIAQGGTFFLDEIGELRSGIQAKLLRVLQDRLFERVGGTERIRADVRFVCATNKDLPAEVAAGRFRNDLYYRINVVPIVLPPLRDRLEEIGPLATHFAALYCRRHGIGPKRITEDTFQCLHSYAWPGNVRELENVIERAVVLGRDSMISPEELPAELTTRFERREAQTNAIIPYHDAVREKRREILRNALRVTEGNQKEAAGRLGISAAYLSKVMKDLEVDNLFRGRSRADGGAST